MLSISKVPQIIEKPNQLHGKKKSLLILLLSLLQELKRPNTNRMYFEAILTTQEYQITINTSHKYVLLSEVFIRFGNLGKCYGFKEVAACTAL